MKDLRELVLEKAEELGWKVEEGTAGEDALSWDFYKMSDAGEDFGFSADGETVEELVEDVSSYYESFDAEEHAASCYGMKGAPGLRALLDDADSIDEMLGDLAKELGDVVENWYLEHDEEEDEDDA